MLIAITGGSGFLGQQLIQKLIKSDLEIALLVRTPSIPQISNLIRAKKIRLVKYDLTKGNKKLSNILRHVDGLVHLAAFVPRSNKSKDDNPIKSIKVNIEGTYNLLRDFESITEKIILTSTLEVYGRPVILPIGESHPLQPLTYYGVSKLAAEKYISVFSQHQGFKSIILRLSTVYGPGEVYDRAIPNFIRRVIKDSPPIIYGSGLDVRDYIYVDDVIDAIITAIHKDCTGTYNIASGKGYTIREVAEKIIQISGKKLKPIFKSTKETPTKIVLDIKKAKEELQFSPSVSIDEGLTEEINWYREVE
jgi:UDP-glucose 4-epimerase